MEEKTTEVEETTVEEIKNTPEDSKDLGQIGKELDQMASSGDQGYDGPSSSSSRGESDPQLFKKSIAEMEEAQHQPTLSIKEFRALKRAKYDKIADNFQYAYVIKNKKTGVIVEVRAATSLHACNIIGWRPRHVQLIEVIDTKKKEEVDKTENSEKEDVTIEVAEVKAEAAEVKAENEEAKAEAV